MPEIPEYVKFDFLITLIGLILAGFSWYLIVIQENQKLSIILVFILGMIVTAIGINEMSNNYAMDKELRRLRYEIEKRELKEKLLKKRE